MRRTLALFPDRRHRRSILLESVDMPTSGRRRALRGSHGFAPVLDGVGGPAIPGPSGEVRFAPEMLVLRLSSAAKHTGSPIVTDRVFGGRRGKVARVLR